MKFGLVFSKEERARISELVKNFYEYQESCILGYPNPYYHSVDRIMNKEIFDGESLEKVRMYTV